MFSTAALLSLVALAIVIVISCFREEWNPGLLGIFFALLVGTIWGNLSGSKVLGFWPTSLFMTLFGVTFLFSMAQENGTLDKLTISAVRLAKGNTALIPLIIFLIVLVLTTIAVALITPFAMAIAGRIGMRAFLMTLLVVGTANAAAFSPFAPTGIVSMELVSKMAGDLGIEVERIVPIE